MAIYKITFTPSGPYFFGNEKTFSYSKSNSTADKKAKEDKLYYIKGEDTPSQTTVFGALRYILLPEKGFNKLGEDRNVEAIGASGFNMDSEEQQSFGWIKRMSAIFVSRGDELFVPTPFDHNCAKEDKTETELDGKKITVYYYTPMKEYEEFGSGNCLDGTTLYLTDYDAKEGLTCSYMSIADGHLEKELFSSDVRVGNNIADNKDGLFKKEYKCLKAGFAFCVFAELDDGAKGQVLERSLVSMGQGKVPFAVSFEKTDYEGFDSVYEAVCSAISKKPVSRDRVYCVSDMVVGEKLYTDTAFAFVKTRDHRSFTRAFDGISPQYKKSSTLHRLVKAGSVFIPNSLPDNNGDKALTGRQKNAFTVGYNQISIIKKTEDK